RPSPANARPAGHIRSVSALESCKPTMPQAVAGNIIQSAFAGLQRLDQCEQHPIHRRADAERVAFAYDEAVEMLDFGFLLPRQILRGGGILSRHRLCYAAHGLV